MAKFVSVRMFLLLFEAILGISATTHWVVTDNGRIQSQVHSVYEMRRPYDLPAFLEQEKRINTYSELSKKIVAKEPFIEDKMAILDSMANVETFLHSFHPDCIGSGAELGDFDFYTSVASDGSWRKGITQQDYLLDGITNEGNKKVPDCKKTFPLDFSVYTFEHLSAMQNRKNLVQHQEEGLLKHLPPGTDLHKYGHQIAHGLLRNSTSWLHLNLAAIYWRVRGDAYNALECARRAIVTSPREFRDIPLLTTGGILHAAKYSAEAAIVLHTAIDHAPTESHQHLALGHVYAVLGDYNRSLSCYDNSLRIAPTMEQARQAKHIILCHQRVNNTIINVHKALGEIVSELHDFQNHIDDFSTLFEKMWDDHSISFLLAGPGAKPFGEVLNVQGRFEDRVRRRILQTDISTCMQRLQNFANQVEKINDPMTSTEPAQRKNERLSSPKKAPIDKVAPELFTVFMGPTRRPKYQNYVIKKSKAPFESKHWPEESECISQSSIIEDARHYVPMHLPPENKGYATHLFVSELIRIDPGKEHPLPWYPPTCQTPEAYDQRNIPQLLLIAASNSVYSPDTSLTPFIADLVQGAELADIGQRILTATKAKVAAPWVLFVLASLHWRINGKPRNALDCLQQALSNVPAKFRDVPLVAIASIGQKLGFVDEALRTTKEALRINAIEPTTNYLYATLLYTKGNNTGAIYHLKQSLRVDPHFMERKALELLKILICEKRSRTRHSGHISGVECIENLELTCRSPETLATYHLRAGTTILCVEDGEDCIPI